MFRTSNWSLLLIYIPQKDENLSRPGWLTYSGRFTHISGHPSAAGQGKFAGQRPTFYHCATQPAQIRVVSDVCFETETNVRGRVFPGCRHLHASYDDSQLSGRIHGMTSADGHTSRFAFIRSFIHCLKLWSQVPYKEARRQLRQRIDMVFF